MIRKCAKRLILRERGGFSPPFTISPQAVDCEACALDVGEAGSAKQSDVLEIRRASFNHNMMPQLSNDRNEIVNDSWSFRRKD
jgi:hypothetical protein